jgi:acyl-CoA synthetase (AMP-forming)/AMP-acid ligase II
MIKRAGQLIPARAVEEVVDEVDGVQRSAALGVAGRGGAEELLVVVERAKGGPDAAVIERASAEAVRDTLGVVPNRVVVGGRGAVPLTGNGKIRYGELRKAHEASSPIEHRALEDQPLVAVDPVDDGGDQSPVHL